MRACDLESCRREDGDLLCKTRGRGAGVQGLFDYGFGYVYYDDVDVDDLGSSSRAGGEMLLGWLATGRPSVSALRLAGRVGEWALGGLTPSPVNLSKSACADWRMAVVGCAYLAHFAVQHQCNSAGMVILVTEQSPAQELEPQ